MKIKGKWIFYPYRGIAIKNHNFGLISPIVNYVTLVSKEDILKARGYFIKTVRNDGRKIGPEMKKLIESFVNGDFEDCSSFIAVRESSSIEAPSKASEKTLVFAATVAIVVFAENSVGFTCMLASQPLMPVERLLEINYEKKSFSRPRNQKYREFPVSIKGIEYTGAKLKKSIFNNDLGFGKVLYDKNANIDKSFYNSIKGATISLYKAVSTNDLSTQLLSGVTSLEVLLTQGQTSFETLRKRITYLLAPEKNLSLEHWINNNLKKSFDARHDFVHEGKQNITEGNVSYTVIFGLATLIMMSNLAVKFPNKSELLKYIDIAIQMKETRLSKHKIHNAFQQNLDVTRKKLKKIKYLKHFFSGV